MPPASSDPSAQPAAHPANALPTGTRLGEFEVLDILGFGGFGIVYLALDHALEREVAIKEYMPAMLAGRTETLHVSLRSASDAETFALGLRSFVNEAKLLARFDHPSLVKVYRFWQANDTAYMAMPVYRGRTLKAVRATLDGPPDEAWMRGVLMPLLGAIDALHSQGVYHRDIAPDNILIEPDGRPVLLDFGAARRVIGDHSQALTAILKPAYAPIEQYAEASAARQGPWTDLYALGATLHFALTGRAPAPSTARTLHDDMQPLAHRALPGCSPAFLQAIDWMLAPRPGDRPQSVTALRAVLAGEAVPHAPAPPPPAAPASWERTQIQPAAPMTEGTLASAALATTRLEPASGGPAQATDLPLDLRPGPAPVPSPAAGAVSPVVPGEAPAAWRGERGARRLAPALAGLVVAGAAGAWWVWPTPPAVRPVPAESAESAQPVSGPVPGLVPVPASSPEDRKPASVPGPMPALPAESTPIVTAPLPDRALPARPVATPAQPAVTSTLPSASPSPVSRPDPVPATAPPVPDAVAPRPAVAVSPVPSPAPPPLSAPAPARPAAVLSDAPEAICGRRVLLAQFVCMEKACRTDQFENHPACRKWWHQNKPAQP